MPAAPGSGTPPALLNLTTTCGAAGGEISFSCNKGISGATCTIELVDDATANTVWVSSIPATVNVKAFTIASLPDSSYTLTANNGEAIDTLFIVVACGPPPVGVLTLVSLLLTQPTAATPTGGARIAVRGGTQPLTVTGIVRGTSATTVANGAANYAVSGLTPADYVAIFADASQPPMTLNVPFTIDPVPVTVAGCQDEYATDYNPAAVTAAACSYTLNWRSAWGPAAVPVRVPALPGQITAYTLAHLFIGFRAGHPLAAARPQGLPLELRATVGPDGYATFRLGHYLRGALGAEDGVSGRRLDLNSPTATTDDLFVGYELRRLTGELLEHGYALNAAVPDGQIAGVLTPFTWIPEWPGFQFPVSVLTSVAAGRYGIIQTTAASNRLLPCPANPLPVAWLNPQGGLSYWVFTGRPQLGDDVGDGSTYQEAETGERRYQDRGAARRTITASSGVFKGADLMEGLRTLWRSPQVWYRPVTDGPWVPVTLDSGSFPAGRMGLARQQVSISFTEAASMPVQGQ